MSAHCSKCKKVRACLVSGVAVFCVICSTFMGYVEDVLSLHRKDDVPAAQHYEPPGFYTVVAIQSSASMSLGGLIK